MVWIKGRKCGVDNCAAIFYQVLSGQRVCRNGHVQEGLETAEDEDVFVKGKTTIHRKKGPKTKTSEGSSIAHGKTAKILMIKGFQRLLIAQAKWLQRRLGLPPIYLVNVRSLWAHYLKASNFANNSRLFNVAAPQLAAICYLASRIIHSDLTLTDLVLFARFDSFPYINAMRYTELNVLKSLSSQIQANMILENVNFSAIESAVVETRQLLSNLKIPKAEPFMCIFKVCDYLALPPVMPCYAYRLFQLVEHQIPKSIQSEELQYLCCVTSTVKLVLLDKNENEIINWFSIPMWTDLMRQFWLLAPDHTMTDDRQVFSWDNADCEGYLDWFERNFTDKRLVKDQKLAEIFDLPPLAEKFSFAFNQKFLNWLHNAASYPLELPEPGCTPSKPLENGGSEYVICLDSSEFTPAIESLVQVMSLFSGLTTTNFTLGLNAFERAIPAEF